MKKMFLLLLFLSTLCCVEEKPFVICRLKGQLGNQMFQISTALSLAIDNGAEAYFPDLVEKQAYNLSNNYERIFSKLNAWRPSGKVQCFYQEEVHNYLPIPFVPNMEIDGFFQSEKYFKHNFEKIRPYFEPPQEILDDLMRDHADIIEHPKTVSLHIRTYYGEHNSHSIFELCSKEYIDQAMALFPEDDILFVVFSDHIWWVKMVLGKTARNIVYIEGQDYLHDFYLMSLCKNNIISNSTFSWWAAYLNKNPDKIVVAPARWFTNNKLRAEDLVPEDWIKISW